MTCEFCTKARANPLARAYSMNCLDCCARLIDATRPSVEQRDTMFAALDLARKQLPVPSRKAIAARLREIRAQPQDLLL